MVFLLPWPALAATFTAQGVKSVIWVSANDGFGLVRGVGAVVGQINGM